jgi:hypothetical protein
MGSCCSIGRGTRRADSGSPAWSSEREERQANEVSLVCRARARDATGTTDLVKRFLQIAQLKGC